MSNLKILDCPTCNLWLDESANYWVDRCDHPTDQLIPVYSADRVRRAIEEAVKAAVLAECERICKAIKEADDYCVTEGDYMLDSDDCIAVANGTWVRPDYSVGAAKGQS